jgi:hypothetical protein
MLVIVDQEESQDLQEAIVMIATQEDTEMMEEDKDLQKDIEMIIEEETEEVHMIGMVREIEGKEAIQEIEEEITIEFLQEIKEEVAMIMIEKGQKEMMTQGIKAIKKQADQDLIVKTGKKDTMKTLKEVTEKIKEKEIIIKEAEIKDLKMKETVIIQEMKAKDPKTFLSKLITIKIIMMIVIIITKQITKKVKNLKIFKNKNNLISIKIKTEICMSECISI